MPIFPVRGLAERGVLTDPSPYQLDLSAWSRGQNMRFHANRAESAPVFRVAYDPLPNTPVFCEQRRLASAGDNQVVVVYDVAQISLFGANALTDVTPTGHTDHTDPRSWTSTFLGDVIYLNRPDADPLYLGPGGSKFATIPAWGQVGGGSPQDWKVRSLRAYGDYLIGMNFTIAGTALQNLVGWSDLTLNGQPPASWDYTDQTTNAGQNPLEATTTPLVDGLPMRGIFVLYTESEVWAMQQTNDQRVFQFEQLFSDRGMLAPNCGVEVLGRHYVFGPNDIYVHDGVQPQSIIDKRNYSKVFDNMDRSKIENFWVHYNEALKTVTFAYCTADPEATFQNTPYPNMGAVYDLVSDTWAFIDLPNVGAMAQVFSTNTLAWQDATQTWTTMGGSWFNLDGAQVPMCAAISAAATPNGITANRLLAYDFYATGKLPYPWLREVNGPQVLERTGIDLDQLGADLKTAKVLRSIMPQVKVTASGSVVDVQVGASMYEGGPIVWTPQQSFDPQTNWKVDFNVAGRYLAVRFLAIQPQDFGVAGFDVDMTTGGHR